MSAGTGVIYIEQNAKWSAIFKLYQDAANTVPVNLTGYSNPRMQIREEANSGTVIATPTISIIDIEKGWLKASLTATQTSAITTAGQTYQMLSNCVYDILIDDSSGEPIRLFNDFAKISPGVTK